MFQKLVVNSFKWKRNVSKFNEEFIKNYDEDSNKGYILEVDIFLNIQKIYIICMAIYHSYEKE